MYAGFLPSAAVRSLFRSPRSGFQASLAEGSPFSVEISTRFRPLGLGLRLGPLKATQSFQESFGILLFRWSLWALNLQEPPATKGPTSEKRDLGASLLG